MKLIKNPNYLKPLFILLMLVLAHNVNSAEGISAKLNFHKKHSKRTFTRAHVQSKNDGNIQSISKNSRKSNTDMTFKALSKRSKFRKSSLFSHSKSRSASENSANSKDPVTITIFAITVAIKITQTILEHYTRKNLNPALTNLKAEREQNAHNVELIQSNEIKTCSAMKLALTIAKHMYNITFFKMIYTDAYMEYLRLQSSRATCDIKIKNRKTKDCIMSQLVEKLKHLKENLTNVFPRMLDSMRDNVRGACEESDLSQELINRNKQIDSDIENIQGKLDEEEASILGAILEGLLSDLQEQKGDLLEINSQLNDSIDDPVKIPNYKKIYLMLIVRLKLGVNFFETVKKHNELKKKNDPSSIQWTQTIKSCLQFLGLIINVVNKFLQNPTLRELEHIIYFVGSLIVLVGHIYAYRTEENEKTKHELKKKLWEKVLDVVFAAGKCIASPVVSMIEESVHLYLKFQSYRESKVILQRSIRDRQIFDLKGERLYELSQKFQTYSQCQMRHFTMMQFFHIFKDVISIEENQLILNQNSQEAWKKIVTQGRSTLRIKGQIKSLCDRNIQFCSRTFSENYLKIEVGLTDTELEGMKREAVYGPYSDIAVAFSPDQADSYILLGYEPLYSKDSISQGMIMLGCRRCSKTHAIRYINLMKSHRHLENHKNLKLDVNLQTKIGKCPITDKICHKLFNDKKNNADGFCRSSEWKTIRVDYRTEESVLGYERVKFAGMTPVLSHLMFYDHGVGSSYVLNVTPKYAIWIDAEKTYYDCNTIYMHPDKNFKQQFLNLFCQECTSDLYAAPIIADTCLGTDSSDKPDNLETIYKINETSLSNQQQYYSDIKLNNIKLRAKIDSECRNSFLPNESGIIHRFTLSNGKQDTIRVKFGFLFKFQEKNLKKYEHNWFLKYKQEIAQQKNPSFFSLANTISKKIEITCEEYFPDSASRNTYREEDFLPCGSSLYYMLSFKPFNNQQGADSVSQSALTLQEIIKMKQSSTEICRKVCDKSQQDICQYDNPSRPTLKPKKIDKIETRLDGSFENGKNSNQIRFSKNAIEWECINIDFGADHLLILNDECGKAGSINRKYIEDEIVISIETQQKEEEENRKYHITSGFIEMQHPKRYEKFSIFSPVNKNKIEYWVRIYIKYDKNEGILPFNDFFYKLGFTSNKVCIETLIKSEFIERLWPRQFIEEENSNGKLFGNALTKIKNPFLDDTTIDLYSFLNKNYSCTYYNLFLPKMFNYNNKERQNLFFKDRLKKTYKKLVKEGDKYYERWSHSGPGLKDIYWIQIANKEEMFNDPKLVQIAWEHGYYPLETVVYEKTKELEDKTWMRVWISYQFKLDEDKEKLCRLCLENSK